MHIPESVKIGPFLFRVHRAEIVDRSDRDRTGYCDYEEGVIAVESGMRDDRANNVFLHEVIHAVNELMGTELDESQVSRLANGLYMVLSENECFCADEAQP